MTLHKDGKNNMRKKKFFYRMFTTAIWLSTLVWIGTFLYLWLQGNETNNVIHLVKKTTHLFIKEIAMGLPIYLLGCWEVYKNPAFEEKKEGK
jgi:hypothetical protein